MDGMGYGTRNGTQAAVEALTSAAVKAVSEGSDVVVLSDKTDGGQSA